MNKIINFLFNRNTFVVLLISVCGLAGFFLSFKLALYGDDWLRLFYLKNYFDASSNGYSYFSIMSYIGPYNMQYPLLFLVRALSGYNPLGYFTVSLFLRIIGSFTFYFVFLKLTKNKILSLLGSLLLVTTPVGIQVTDWVFYMNTYAALIPLGLTLYFILSMEECATIKNQFFIIFFATLFIFLIPVRSYGFVYALVIYTIGKIIIQKGKKRKFALDQLVLLIGIYSFAKVIGDIGPTTDVLSSIASGMQQAYSLLLSHSYSFILIPFSILGKQLLPDILFTKLQNTLPRLFQPELIFFIFFVIVSLLTFFFANKKLKYSFPIIICINSLVYIFISAFFISSDLLTKMYAEIALIVLLDCIAYMFLSDKKKELLIVLLFIFGFSLPYFLLPWSFNPALGFDTAHRYMYFPEIGIICALIYIASVLYKSGKAPLRLLTSGIIIFIVISNIYTDNIYFRNQLRFRSQERFVQIFTSFQKQVPILPKDQQTVFYITDMTGKPNDVYAFGFPFHTGLMYGITSDGILSFIIPNKEELVSAATDGKSLKKYTLVLKKINYNDVIYLKLLPNDNFINNKSEVLKQIYENK